MTSNVNVYRKKMSKIQHLQKESEVFYNLLITEEQNRKIYGIQVAYQKNTCHQVDEIADIDENENKVRDLLTLLYENAIMIDVWRDVIQDALLADLLL